MLRQFLISCVDIVLGVMLRVVSFDCYGTLVDWLYSFRNYLGMVFREFRNIDELVKEFLAIEQRLIMCGKFIKYSNILKSCLYELARKLNIEVTPEVLEGIVIAFAKSPPFPDVYPSLKIIKNKFNIKLAILSNTERRLINITLCGMEDLFDYIITAEDVGTYKPNIDAFRKFLEILNVLPEEVLHVSAYIWYDLEPARRVGMKTLLVDRYGFNWDLKVGSLLELPDIISRFC